MLIVDMGGDGSASFKQFYEKRFPPDKAPDTSMLSSVKALMKEKNG